MEFIEVKTFPSAGQIALNKHNGEKLEFWIFKHACTATHDIRISHVALCLPLAPYIVCANSKGSGKIAQARLSLCCSPM